MTTEYFPLKQLTDQFYKENGHLERVLDKLVGQTEFINEGKVRGYGVVVIDYKGLRFGIPLRSKMTHKYGFTTEIWQDENGKKYRKGLDYTKAVILDDDSYITERSFKIPAEQFDKINDSQEKIRRHFNKFVEKYIIAVERNDRNLLTKNYRDSSLINYHVELGITGSSES